eukprot:CAMPEP_0119066370 /NCGR_PEP_ID=MMETSP1178-20130426/8932_1 /TAXON_ID=33656 /ORGANISM="unid sp, Strain CCMP2000" /LENGTH=685 /DNA_ID=CAMNT_0007047965 /DNA_START=40 /DNA_END=2097 /DNA_ORIENTATION=+
MAEETWSAEQVNAYLKEHDVLATVEKAVNVAVKKHAARPIADVGLTLLAGKQKPETARPLSLPKSVAAFGGIAKWNAQPRIAQQVKMLDAGCTAATVAEALEEVRGIMNMGHNLWAYSYLRKLFERDATLYYGTLAADPALLLPVAYTPTVGEACQKFGKMPLYSRGCYVSIRDRGNVKAVLREYAEAMLPKAQGQQVGQYDCQCIVFSDGGRILGLGDLAAWGMGIPIGKLDLYTVCGGFDPARTIPVILDAGCFPPSGNSAGLEIRNDPLYTGTKQDRVVHTSDAGTQVNSAYYGPDSFIGEFMGAAASLFGPQCLLQFEDFNSNDAFPLLAQYREQFLTYNDDIQGTAAVAVAAVLGGIKIQRPQCSDLVAEARGLRFLFHGAGSANLGAASLLIHEAQVPAGQVACTNSKGLIWKSADGSEGSFRNNEQKAVATVGRPDVPNDLKAIVESFKPDVLVGAVGRGPGCFTKEVVEAMVAVQEAKGAGGRPIIFALSNPKTQAEITAADCYAFSNGKAIYGSGTRFKEEVVSGQTREPGQVNNFFIFPGMSFGAISCAAKTIPESFFMVAAEAVAHSLDAHDLAVESVVPHPARIRTVAENVATAVVLAAQAAGLAGKCLGSTKVEVAAALKAAMWSPKECATAQDAGRRTSLVSSGAKPGFKRTASDLSGGFDHELPPDAADH